jgi:hypothetical protein
MKISSNEGYFNKIDTEAKAYFLGLLYADGNVYLRPKRQSAMQIVLQKQDWHILEAFQKELQSQHKKSVRQSKGNRKEAWGFTITSNKLCSDLIRLGCIPKKSLILEWPTEKQVPKKFIRHFMRGYFDGDGSVYSSITGRHKNPQFGFNFVGTFSTCSNISKILHKDSGLFLTVPRKKESIYSVFYSGNKNTKKFFHYLYDNASFFLLRKKNKMSEVLNIIPYRV